MIKLDERQEDFKNKIISYVSSLMTDKLRSTVSNYLHAYGDISEVRLRTNAPLSFTVSGGNLVTGVNLDSSDVNSIINKMTDGNYFKNEEIMKAGFISLKYGIRVGVCGDVFVSGGVVKVLKQVTSINIRIPVTHLVDSSILLTHIENNDFKSSILVFSPPCSGKTTLLRSVAHALSSEPYQKRVSVIDTNRELKCYFGKATTCEYLEGYPKAYGINLAVRYMNPEYLICDEIGGEDEVTEITAAMHCGVPLIASAHADSFSSLLHRKSIAMSLENGVFDSVLSIKRNRKSFEYLLKKVSEL